MSGCNTDNKCGAPPPPEPSCSSGGGFWESLFGGSSTDDAPAKAGPDCLKCGGKDKCCCNNELTDHLKKCAGYGNLPPLIEKCEDIPGYGKVAGYGKRSADLCNRMNKDGSDGACGGPPPPDKCKAPPKPDCACEPPPKKEEKCSNGKAGKLKCPPMPETDCCDCKPIWMKCPPPISQKMYPVPEGVTVLPISVGGRNNGSGGGSCGKCGQDKKDVKPNIKVANCPMMRPRCPGTEKEEKGFFAKLLAMFKK